MVEIAIVYAKVNDYTYIKMSNNTLMRKMYNLDATAITGTLMYL
jgi:hypothetical protein